MHCRAKGCLLLAEADKLDCAPAPDRWIVFESQTTLLLEDSRELKWSLSHRRPKSVPAMMKAYTFFQRTTYQMIRRGDFRLAVELAEQLPIAAERSARRERPADFEVAIDRRGETDR